MFKSHCSPFLVPRVMSCSAYSRLSAMWAPKSFPTSPVSAPGAFRTQDFHHLTCNALASSMLYTRWSSFPNALAMSHPAKEPNWIYLLQEIFSKGSGFFILFSWHLKKSLLDDGQDLPRLFAHTSATFKPLMNPAMIFIGNLKILYFIPELLCWWPILA